MTIYQEEMQRKAQRYGCITDYDEADQLLLISHKGVHLTAVNPEGFMFYNSKELTDPESREVSLILWTMPKPSESMSDSMSPHRR